MKVNMEMIKRGFVLALLYTSVVCDAQSPKLEIQGHEHEFIKISGKDPDKGGAIQFTVEDPPNLGNTTDWHIGNFSGNLGFSSYNFGSESHSKRLFFSEDGYVGLGTSSPETSLHLNGNTVIDETNNGLLMIGKEVSDHLLFDWGHIQARSGNSSGDLYLQNKGGNTHTAGNTYFRGSVSAGTLNKDASLTIADPEWQFRINNRKNDNDWYFGASNNSWSSGGGQLLISPSNSHDDAILRLHELSDNNGFIAPVMITSNAANQTLLLDGNEIDGLSPLYINHNTASHTCINPNGGLVGIGTDNVGGSLLRIKRPSNPQGIIEPCLALETDNHTWGFGPTAAAGGTFFFYRQDIPAPLAWIDPVTGAWGHVSDRRVKEDIINLEPVTNKISKTKFYSYEMKGNESEIKQIGVIAQQLMKTFPEAVSAHGDLLMVDYDQLAVVALKGAQEVRIKQAEYKAVLSEQKEELNRMEKILNDAENLLKDFK